MRSVADRNVVMRRIPVYLFKNRLEVATNTHPRPVRSAPKIKHLRTTLLHTSAASLLKAMHFNCGYSCEMLRTLNNKASHSRYSGPTESFVHFHLNQRRTQALGTLHCHFTKLRLVETSENWRLSGMSVRVESTAKRLRDLSVFILLANSHYEIQIII
jgi:hypothetical protein